ncbi:MAG: GerW family sporulation protein [Eubacteriales bacterium]|nr:GerW family sporulation protein [Eubacteriales bacterium]
MSHPIENILKTTMEELKQMVDVNTIIGSPITLGADTVIVPVSRVSMGFVSGGGEYGEARPVIRNTEDGSDCDARHPFAGASVAGMNLTPMAFLTVTGDCVKVLPAHYCCTLDRIIELVPQTVQEVERLIKEGRSARRKDGMYAGESENAEQ